MPLALDLRSDAKHAFDVTATTPQRERPASTIAPLHREQEKKKEEKEKPLRRRQQIRVARLADAPWLPSFSRGRNSVSHHTIMRLELRSTMTNASGQSAPAGRPSHSRMHPRSCSISR